jgi:hypothetical protein
MKMDLHSSKHSNSDSYAVQFRDALNTCWTESFWCMFNSATVDLNLKYLQYEFTKDCATMISSIFNCQVNATSIRKKYKTYGGTSQSQRNKVLHLEQVYTNSRYSYWLDDRGIGIRVPVGSNIFTSPCRPDRFRAHPSTFPVGTGGSLGAGVA